MSTLGEIIKDYEGKKVKIGSLSGFFFCGRVTESFSSKLNELNSEIYAALGERIATYKKYLGYNEKLLSEYRMTLNNKKRQLKKWEGNKDHEEILSDRIARLEENIAAKEKYSRTIKGAISACTEKLGAFSPLTDREVREVYPSMLHKDVTIILVEGEEVGKYWDIDECESEVENGRVIRGFNRFELSGN